MRKLILFLCCLLLCASTAARAEEADTDQLLQSFTLKHGDRSSMKIAITIDDGYQPEYYWKCAELCRQYGVGMTFFPIGLKLAEEDRENWRAAIEAGCEIGSHGYAHINLGKESAWGVIYTLGRFQERLDEVLGFHYQARWLRPPYGNLADDNGSEQTARRGVQAFGYEHSLKWDVSETNPDKAIKQVRGGSILLFHARAADYACIEALLPKLLEAGFEPVTVSTLFNYPPPEIGEDLYVYDKSLYEGKK